MPILIVRNFLIFLFISLIHAFCNYFNFIFLSSIDYDGKAGIILRMLQIIGSILWLPMEVLSFTKFWYILEWNYPAMLIVNSFIAGGIFYMLIFFKKPFLMKIFFVLVGIFLLWFVFIILGVLFLPKK